MTGWEILRMRRALDLSQEDFGYLLGISPCTVLRYEREQSRADGLVLELLAALDLATKDRILAQHIRAEVKARSARLEILYYVLVAMYGAGRGQK